MASHQFSTTIQYRTVFLKTASDVARFSFIVQDTLSHLDLQVSGNSMILDDHFRLCDSCRPRPFRHFVNTEEKCRQLLAPRRRLLYTLHLDLPKGIECSLKDVRPSGYFWRCCRIPIKVSVAVLCRFHATKLSDFIEDALSVNVPKRGILKWILKVPFHTVPLLSGLQIRTASKFINCFYPEITDSELLKDFIKQFPIQELMMDYENPEIFQFLLYHARLHGNISLQRNIRISEFISICISNKYYLNVRPILNYISDSEPTSLDYDEYLSDLSVGRPFLTEIIEAAAESKTKSRLCRMVQIIWIFIDIQSSLLPFDNHKAASEALRLIWSSIPDACITFTELKDVFGAVFSEVELMHIHGFYVGAIGEYHTYIHPRSLQHLCRTVLRRTFQRNSLWIPDAIRRTGLPNSLQAFLNLKKPFGVSCTICNA